MITPKEFSDYCNSHAKEIYQTFGKEYPDDDSSIKENGIISEEFASVILNVLENRDYDIFFNPVSDMQKNAFSRYDAQTGETVTCDATDLIGMADRIANEYDIDFDNPENNPDELKCYRMLSDFLEYPYPSAARFQAKWIYDQDVTSVRDINETLEMLGVSLPDFAYGDGVEYEKYHDAVWNLSQNWSERKAEFEKHNSKSLDEHVSNFLKLEM